MRLDIKIVGLTAVIAIAAVLLVPMGSPTAASGEEVIKSRLDFMRKVLRKHFNTINAYAKSGKGTPAEIEKSAIALQKLAKKIPSHFPKGTGRGDYPAKMTRALPAIWQDPKAFEKAYQFLADESAKLAAVAKTGNKDAILKQIGPAGKYSKSRLGCGSCHKKFRGKRVKK